MSDPDHVVRDTYRQEQDRSLTEAIVDGIESCKGEDLRRTDFALFEDVDQEALDDLLRPDAQPRTTVTLSTDDIQVELRGDGDVDIEVVDLAAE